MEVKSVKKTEVIVEKPELVAVKEEVTPAKLNNPVLLVPEKVKEKAHSEAS